MGRVKDLWFDEMQRLTGKYIDQGMDPEDAYEKACNRAQDSLMDQSQSLPRSIR